MMTIRIIILAALTGVVEGQNLNEEGQELQETKRSLANKAGLSEFGSLVDDVRSLQCGGSPPAGRECPAGCSWRRSKCRYKKNGERWLKCTSGEGRLGLAPKAAAISEPSFGPRQGPTPRQPSFATSPAASPPALNFGGSQAQSSRSFRPAPSPRSFGLRAPRAPTPRPFTVWGPPPRRSSGWFR